MLECIPNISSSNKQLIAALKHYLENQAGCKLYNIDRHESVNRSVFTYLVEEANFIDVAIGFFKLTYAAIDMQSQNGLHPRIGAIDVFPVVPLGKTSKKVAVQLTHQLAEQVGKDFGIPIYLYEHSQKSQHRKRLEQIRKGGYEGLTEKMQLPEWQADYGPTTFNQQSGVTVMGVRDILIAINFGLNNASLQVAKVIAKKIRSSGYLLARQRIPGLLPNVKAIGWRIPEYQMVQVSVNITDYKTTGLHKVYTTVNTLAKEYRSEISHAEIIGILPEDALLAAGKKFNSNKVGKEELINGAIDGLKLDNELNPNLRNRIINFTSLA